jgi:hypothetical protein
MDCPKPRTIRLVGRLLGFRVGPAAGSWWSDEALVTEAATVSMLTSVELASTIQRRACLAFAACCPSARRVFFGKCLRVCFRFAAWAAFLIFFRAAARCFFVAINLPWAFVAIV